MERLASLPLLFEPGTRWNYSMSTDVCGRLVEVMSGQSLDEFFRDRILEPLGMRDTGVLRAGVRGRPLLAALHHAAATVTLDRSWPPSTTMVQPPKFLSGGGGLVGTARDYLRFCHMLLATAASSTACACSARARSATWPATTCPAGKLLNEMGQTTFSEAAMEGTGFGLGFSVIEDAAALPEPGQRGRVHAGAARPAPPSGSTRWRRSAAVFMTQLLPSDTYPIRRQLRAAVLQAVID